MDAHRIRPVTRVVAAVLYVFLLFMQQEAIRHGFDHLRAELDQAHQRSIALPAGTRCDECALLAAGAQALPGAEQVISLPVAVSPLPAAPRAVASSRSLRYYSARAPPSLS
jgi:hypothetical protein